MKVARRAPISRRAAFWSSRSENILEAYQTGRGSFPSAREDGSAKTFKRGTYQIVVTEIPYQVQKSKLIEKIAELIQTKKLPMLDDVRDESAEDIRLVLVPKSQNIEQELLMESLFRQTDLEIKFALNMNVLDNGLVPKVMNLKDVLQAWLTHRQVVLVRRSTFRLDKVVNRIEVLEGYLIVYLNIDKVIKIIRTKDEPKEELMKAFKLSGAAGRGHPEHASAFVAQAGGDRAAPRARGFEQGARLPAGAG